jgi:FecR protein
MDTRGRVPALVLAGIFALLPLAAGAQSIGSAAAVKPDAEGGGSPLQTGSSVYANETVHTGQSGVAELRFVDETKLSVGPTSTVRLDKFVYDPSKSGGKVVINASRGAYRFVTGVQDPRNYEIKTPYATLGVRGTVVEANMEGVDCEHPERLSPARRKACAAAGPCGGGGYEKIRLVEGKFFATNKKGETKYYDRPGSVVTICENGTFAQTQFSSTSILNFTPLQVAALPINPGILAAAAAAGAVGIIVGNNNQNKPKPCNNPSCN